jgi:hypothetical protein
MMFLKTLLVINIYSFSIKLIYFIVGVYAEGKKHAMAIGITKMSTEDM